MKDPASLCGLIDPAKENRQFRELERLLREGETRRPSLATAPSDNTMDTDCALKSDSEGSSEKVCTLTSKKADIIFRIKFMRQKAESVAAAKMLSIDEVTQVLTEYRMHRSFAIGSRAKEAKPRQKIKEPHLEWLASKIKSLSR